MLVAQVGADDDQSPIAVPEQFQGLVHRLCIHIEGMQSSTLSGVARSLSEYSPVLPHCPWVSLGLGLFGHGPRARRALSPPQLVAALQERRQIFRRLWVKQISCHSADTFSSPRNKNLRIPRADLI